MENFKFEYRFDFISLNIMDRDGGRMRKRLRQRAAKRAFDQRNRQRLLMFNRVLEIRDNLHMGPADTKISWDDFGSIIHHCMEWSRVANFFALQVAHPPDGSSGRHVLVPMSRAEFSSVYPELMDDAIATEHVPVIQTWINAFDGDPLFTGAKGSAADHRRSVMYPVGDLDPRRPI